MTIPGYQFFMSLKRYSHFCRWCVFIGHEYINEWRKTRKTSIAFLRIAEDTLFVFTQKTSVKLFVMLKEIYASKGNSPNFITSLSFSPYCLPKGF